MPRPRGGDWLAIEMERLRGEGADIVASLLTPEEETELDLVDEGAACEQAGLEFRRFAIPDRQTPDHSTSFAAFVRELHGDALRGRAVVAHCRAGIGRSSVLLASMLTLSGYSVQDAFIMISGVRGFSVPDTPEQIEWVDRFARSLRT